MKPNSQYSGRLIAFEGLDGSGKSTQIHLLERWLVGQGCRVFYSEWASSDLVKGATRRGKKQQLFTPTTFSLVHATDFADRYERQILPMLKGGFVVLCDRYTFTSFARDRVRGCDPDWLRELYGFAHSPDLTFFLDLPLHLALDRTMDQHESFRLYQGRVLEQYLQMANEFGFTLLDATRDIHEQQETIRGIVAERINLAAFRERGTR